VGRRSVPTKWVRVQASRFKQGGNKAFEARAGPGVKLHKTMHDKAWVYKKSTEIQKETNWVDPVRKGGGVQKGNTWRDGKKLLREKQKKRGYHIQEKPCSPRPTNDKGDGPTKLRYQRTYR